MVQGHRPSPASLGTGLFKSSWSVARVQSNPSARRHLISWQLKKEKKVRGLLSMWANIKAVDLKVNFSRRYYSSFVLKPCASEGFLLFCDCACSCVIFAYILVCVQANAWTLYGMQSHSPLWLIMVSCLPSHFVTSLPFQSDNAINAFPNSLQQQRPQHGNMAPV